MHINYKRLNILEDGGKFKEKTKADEGIGYTQDDATFNRRSELS